MAKVVFVVSGATYLILKDGTRDATGYWAEEFARPYKILTDAGHEVVVATPSGTGLRDRPAADRRGPRGLDRRPRPRARPCRRRAARRRFVQLNVTDENSVAAAAKTIEAHSGLDVLVNNAGIEGRTPETTMRGTETSWRLLAACRSADLDLFFPVSTSGQGRDLAEQAKAVCAQCWVRSVCLAFALATRQVHGVWGGMSEQERLPLVVASCTTA
jgi:NAD(P)-dependent dehydrogenase (short-subunit alcohol dehydrogenase family)